MAAAVAMCLWRIVLVCAMLIAFGYCSGLSVFGPKKIRPNSNFTIVFCNSLQRHVELRAVLENDADPSILQESKKLIVKKQTVSPIEFNVGKIIDGKYQLVIASIDQTFSFNQQVDLDYDPKTMSTFIQTDKPVYAPGDKLRFRVIVVDVNTRPVTSIKTIRVSIKDSEFNSIREWPYAKLYRGVFESSVQLPSSPPLGNWTMSVNADDIETNKYFEVKEYVLPKFFVKAYPSEILLQKDKVVSITVETAYTFGEPIEGNFTAQLILDKDTMEPAFTKQGKINGKTSFVFELAEEVEIEGDNDFTEVTLNVQVQETFSNSTVNITEELPIYLRPYVITLQTAPLFKPGLPFTVTFSIKDHLGQPPAVNKPRNLFITADFDLSSDGETISKSVKLNEYGVGSVELKSHEDAVKLRFKAIYDAELYDEIHDEIDAAKTENNQHIKVNINPRFKVQINKDVEFSISCTELMTHFAYIVVARGQIVKSSYVKVQRKKTSKLRLKMTADMSPKARLLVFYTNREFVIYDDVELKFDSFNNDFKVTLNKEDYRPGNDISFNVYAFKDSYVAFSAVDQSVLLVGQARHDFNRNDVLNELSLYGDSSSDNNDFDIINKYGLFLRSTANVEGATSRSGVGYRYGSSILRRDSRRMKAVRIRTKFEEAWFWKNFTMDGRKSVKQIIETVPDSITTYFVSGFALSPTMGLGVIRQPLKFTIKQPFYLVANLPYSIKRGEVALVQVTVFNYLGNRVTTTVTLFNKREEIEFVEQSSNDNRARTKTVLASTGDGTSVSFLVKAKKIGLIAIKLQADSLLASDAIEHMLRVTPESHLYVRNEAKFIQLEERSTQKHDFVVEIPQKYDAGSIKTTFTLDPNILGTAIENLDSLIRLPSGCGEQNMLHFVPNIVILDYLSETKTVADSVKEKAIDYLTKGLQNQLRYRRSDGSFSLWETSNGGSTFLTAFVAKSLKIADKHITVDKNIVNNAFDWLVSKQSDDGQFPEVGTVFHKEMQGGIQSSRFALTAYVLIALAEDKEILKKYQDKVNLTANYLRNRFNNITDEYDLSLITYGFSLMGDPFKETCLRKLTETAILDKDSNELYWNRTTLQVEIAGYALLSYMLNNMPIDATLIMRWLSKQRYDRGGYAGTQDTFVGLKALAAFAAKISADKNDYRVTISHKPDFDFKFEVDYTNNLKIQEVDIPAHVRKLKVEAAGIGYGIIQVAYQYYQNAMDKTKYDFNLNVKLMNTTTNFVQHLHVCVAYEQKESGDNSSMALVEIFLPSGLIVGNDAVKDLTGRIQKVERRMGDTSLVVYYNSLSKEFDCFEVEAQRVFQVALHLPSYVKVYDYYNTDAFAITQYEGKVMQLCDICEDEDCESLSCENESNLLL